MSTQAFEALAERMTQALLSGDFAAFAGVMALPLRFAPRGDPAYVMQTEAELRVDFELYHNNLIGRGVTDIFRQVVDVTELSAGKISVLCLTHIMVRAQRITDPFETRFLLTEQSDGWRIAEIESSLRHLRNSLGRSDIFGATIASKLNQ